MSKYENFLSAGLIKGQANSNLLKIALTGLNEKLSPSLIFSDIKVRRPDMLDSEIYRAINKACSSFIEKPSNYQFQRPVKQKEESKHPDYQRAREALITKGIEGINPEMVAYELLERSNTRLINDVEKDSSLLISVLYKTEDKLVIGDKFTTLVKTRDEWLKDPKLNSFPYIMPNPVSGLPIELDSGKISYRSDRNIKDFRFCIIEFDTMPKNEQAAFWLGMIKKNMPVVCLIDSGGKSIHSWISVNCKDSSEWTEKVENRLFREFFIPLGADKTFNESRLSRLPGHFRSEKKEYQKLLYLNPEAGVLRYE